MPKTPSSNWQNLAFSKNNALSKAKESAKKAEKQELDKENAKISIKTDIFVYFFDSSCTFNENFCATLQSRFKINR